VTLTESLLLFLVVEHTAMNLYGFFLRSKHSKGQAELTQAVRGFEKAFIMADLTWRDLSRKLNRKEK
jgi:hypothetical protein